MMLFRTVLIFALMATAHAVPVYGEILLDQQPLHTGGPGADTAFYTDFGAPVYQLTADDFVFSEHKVIHSLRWWGFYGGNFSGSHLPPIGDETMRVRFYDDTGYDGLPGDVLYEVSYLNPPRTFTGQIGCGTCNAWEYQFDVDLTVFFHAEADRRYWLEIVQIGDIDSHYRIEYASGNATPYAVQSVLTNDNWIYTETNANISIQLHGVPEVGTLSMCLLVFVLSHSRMNRTTRRIHELGDRRTQTKEVRVCHPPGLLDVHPCSPYSH